MKSALVILLVCTVLALRWWEFLCAHALGLIIDACCKLGFTP